MIVRILGEGQFELTDDHLKSLNELDDALEAAVDGGDDEAFRARLIALLDKVRELGSAVPDDVLKDSDLILPPADAHVSDVKELLGDDGLIPG